MTQMKSRPSRVRLRNFRTKRKAFFKVGDFKQILCVEHDIAEGGDLESHTLMGQKKDGSWVSLSYT